MHNDLFCIREPWPPMLVLSWGVWFVLGMIVCFSLRRLYDAARRWNKQSPRNRKRSYKALTHRYERRVARTLEHDDD